MVNLVRGREAGTTGRSNIAGEARATAHIHQALFATISIYALGLALGLTHPTAAHANGWIGTNSTNWFDPGNWGLSQVPNGSSFVLIETRTPNEAVVGAPGAQAYEMWIGYQRNAALTIQNGGTLSSTYAGLGVGPLSTGIVTVTGPNSSWTNADLLYVGVIGTGTLLVSDGGKVTSAGGVIAIDRADAGIGTATVDGFGSSWINAGTLTVGGGGIGTLIVSNGGLVSNAAGSQGSATIDGLNSTWTNFSDLTVGSSGSGSMGIWNHGAVSNDSGYIGLKSGSTGTVTVDGAGSTWVNGDALYVGMAGAGTLTIQNGGAVNNTIGWIGFNTGSTGTVTVNDTGSSWTNSGNLYVGGASSAGTLTIQNGGTVRDAIGAVGYTSGSSGVATVADPGSSWTNSGALYVGQFGTGSLTVRNQGTLSSSSGYIAANSGSVGNAFIVGLSSWTMSGDLFIGAAGAGALTIRSGGTVNVGGDVIIAGSAGSSGTLKIGAGSGEPALAAGTLNATSVSFGADTGRIVFNHSSPNYVFAPQISGAGSVTVESGTTILTGNSTYSGGTTINGGTLQIGNGGVTGSIAGDIGDNGTLAFNRSDAMTYSGAISGNGAVRQIGTGTTILTGNSSYSGGTTISGGALQIGNGGTSGSITGDVVNNGVLAFNRADAMTFAGNITGSGAVRQSGTGSTILTGASSYAGDTFVTDGRLQFGDGSSGAANTVGGSLYVSGGTLAIQTPATLNVAHNVELADNTALSIAAGANFPSMTADHLTIGNGVAFNISGINSADQNDKVLIATQTGISGDFDKVTVGGSSGGVDYLAVATHKSADNLQYLASFGLSWTANNNLAQGTFTLTNPSDSFSVGTVLADRAANPATSWDGKSLTKAGAGLLILTGDNTYSGGTTIAGGTLQVGDGGSTGSITGNVVDNGVLAFKRSDIVTFAGGISGSGVVRQTGSGTLILSGANSYSGGTEMRAGTLSVAADTNLGAASGELTFSGGTLATTGSFNTGRSVALQQTGRFDVAGGTELGLTGVISRSGDLVKDGAGTLRLDNGGNAYGNTFIQAGTLIGRAGSISGNIGNAAAVVFDQAADASFAGDIAALNGARGNMIKQGGGMLTLTGSSSLDWTIAGGGLVTAAERFGGNAAIGAGSSLTFEQSADASYAGTLSGSGGFHKTGTGLLKLTGDSSAYAGATAVENGTLAVNGKLGGSVAVGDNGRLGGSGTVGSLLVAGTVAPGNSIGTLNVAGDITFGMNSIYEVEVDAAGNSDRIIAGGKATITGGTVKVLAGAGNYAPQTKYIILTANGADGVVGTFNGVTSNLAFLDPSLSYDASNVFLTMTRNNIDFAGVGITPNQIATGGGVESLGWGNPVYDAVLNLSASQVRYASDQLSGEVHASAKTALIEDSRFVRNAVNDRIRAAFDGVGAANGGVVTYVDGKPVAVSATTDGLAVWGQGFGSWGHTDGDRNAARMNRKTGGFFVGADAPVFDTWRFGAVTGYSRTDFDVKSRHSSGTSDNYHLGLYGGTQWGDLAFRTGAAYTWHDISTSRNVSFPGFGNSLKGDYNAATAQNFGELAYGFNAGGARFEPFANLAYVSLHADGFTERGGAAALTSPSSNTDATFTTLGLRASTTFDMGGASLTAKGMLGWRHAFGNVTPFSTMRFAGGGNAFEIGGVPIARDAAVIEAGLDYAITPNAALGVTYGGQFGSGMADQSVKANFNVKF